MWKRKTFCRKYENSPMLFHSIMNLKCGQCGKSTKGIEKLEEDTIMKPLCWKQENVWRPTRKCTKVRKDNRNHLKGNLERSEAGGEAFFV